MRLIVMKYDAIAQKVYTSRTTLYHFFIHVVGYARAVKKFMIQSNYLKPGMRILDAGCGGGLATKIMYQIALKNNLQNVSFHGFDLTPAMLNYFRRWITKKNVVNVKLAQADVLKPDQLPPNWKNFDLVTVSGMLEHIPRHRIVEAIRNLKYLLNPHGKLLIFICKKNTLSHWIIRKWWKAESYTTSEIKTIMTDAGFTQFTHKNFPSPFGYLNYWSHVIEARRK